MKADNFIISFCAECFKFQYKMQQSLVIKSVVQIMSYMNFSIGNIFCGRIELCRECMKQSDFLLRTPADFDLNILNESDSHLEVVGTFK